MNLWNTVQLLQGALFLCAVLCGALALRLPWKYSIIAGLLALPAPLFQVTAGAAGFVYAADILGLLGFLALLLGCQRRRFLPDGSRFFTWTSVVLLLVWPVFSNLAGMLQQDSLDLRHIGLSLMRGLVYWSLFVHAIRLASEPDRAERMLAVGCLSIGLVCAIGVAQFYLGFNIDLWNAVRELNPTEHTDGFGGGFMGLYRGAVGAWAAAILAITPLVFFHRRMGWLTTAILTAALLGGILVTGSRQGAIFGLFGVLVGLGISFVAATRGNRTRNLWNIARTVVALSLIGWLVAMKGVDRSFYDWLSFRFNDSLEGEGLFQAGLKRETKAQPIFEQLLERPAVLAFGVGQSAIVDEVPDSGDAYSLVYVDSEILWVLQQGGLVHLLLYLLFLFQAARAGISALLAPASENRRLVGCATSAIIVGTGFTFGHFFLLHVQSSHSPVACWNWWVLGLGVATLMKRGRVPATDADEPGFDEAGVPSEMEAAA